MSAIFVIPKAALNFVFSFLRIVRLRCNCWKFLCLHIMYFFLKQDILTLILWRYCLFLVLILCVDEFVWYFSWFLTMKFIKESICWHETGRTSVCLNRLLREVLGCAPAKILISFFCKVKIFPLLEELPQTVN